MTKLLVSVRNREESLLAFQGGAHIIDVKEPMHGSLGAASLAIIQSIADAIPTPVSAACGELLEGEFPFEMLPANLSLAKLGLRGCANVPDWPTRLRAAWSRMPTGIGRVGVVYADWSTCEAPRPDLVIGESAKQGCAYLLLDTCDKRRGDLFSAASWRQLETWLRLASGQGLRTVVAGSLRTANLPRALRLRPDYVAVRGAACRGGRTGPVCQANVRALSLLLRQHGRQREDVETSLVNSPSRNLELEG